VLDATINVLRGALIGVAEVIPGVSGGTIALIVGIYETLIKALDDAVHAVRRALGLTAGRPDPKQSLRDLARLPWALIIPVVGGMLVAVVLGARFIEPLLEEQPVAMRALFFGLVLGGTFVPAHMVLRTLPGRWRGWEAALAVGVALVIAILLGLPPGDVQDPGPLAIMASAAVAVCALVLPGVSGSFLLLTLGMYAPTVTAVNDRDLVYLTLFALGAVLGLAAFVGILRWLLENRARLTLVVITGLMIGSLRALWPWQADGRELLAPTEQVGVAVLLALAGVAIVAGLLVVERRFGASEEQVDFPDQPSPRSARE
jgi:putative membrane protein